MELKPIWELIDWNNIDSKFSKSIPDWIDPRDPNFLKETRTPMPGWIQELADWAMKTGNYKKIDKLLELAYKDDYNTPWSKEQIEQFKYGDKYTGLKKYTNKQSNILQEYFKAINPKELYHRDPKEVFDKFDLSKAGVRADGSKYKLNWGPGAYTSVKNDPSLNKLYGDKVSRFLQNSNANLLNSKEIYKANFFAHPYFREEDLFGKKFQEYLKMKGYGGIDNDWERVFYNPDKDLLPANTKYQRFVNRFFNNQAIKYGGKILNRVATPLAIIEGLGFDQPVY